MITIMRIKDKNMEVQIKRKYNIKYLSVDVCPRFYNDSRVNGIDDVDLCKEKGIGIPNMPCVERIKDFPKNVLYSDHYRWRPIIDIDEGIIINWKQGVTADVNYKVCDDGIYILLDDKKNEIVKVESYVPNLLSIDDWGDGDYINLTIDEDGKIENWYCYQGSIDDLLAGDLSCKEKYKEL
jgi:hypothetical protein